MPLALSGCSGFIKGTALEGTTLIIQDAQTAFFAEADYDLARDAAPSNLKLIEGLLIGAPDDDRLLLAASQNFGGYAFGFVEQVQTPAFTGNEPWAKRCRILYKRGMEYSMRMLNRDEWFVKTYKKDMDGFSNILKNMPDSNLPALFWAAYNWANYINVSKSDPEAIADLAWVEQMMRRAQEIDPTYYHGGPNLFYIAYYGGRSQLLGGDPDKARIAYQKARDVDKGKFLMVDVMYASQYAVQQQDKALFTQLLNDVLAAPDDLYPAERLANEIAKHKATELLAHTDELF
ncbi:MAG: hypothetical protein JOY51_04470 [Nevskia sp.]|nr:hypothetical protein [Nevskia sp.]